MKKNQKVIIFEGADMTGKSIISKKISEKFGIPYFKNTGEWKHFLNPNDYFVNTLIYAEPYFVSYLAQTKASVVLDRSYPSEWVYSKAFNRKTDEVALKRIDESFASLGAKIVVCHRSSYEFMADDRYPEKIDSKKLAELDELYNQFVSWTKCKVVRLNVDDENLDREIRDITVSLEL